MWPKLFATVFVATALASLTASGQGQEKSAASVARSEANATVNAAMTALRQGDYAAAIPALQKLTAMAPDVPE